MAIIKAETLPIGPNSRNYEVGQPVSGGGPIVTQIKQGGRDGRIFISLDNSTVIQYPANSIRIVMEPDP